MTENSTFSQSNNDDSIIDISTNNAMPLPRFDEERQINTNIYQDWKVGQKFSRKLNLNTEQIELLDKLNFSDNVFNEISFCKIQILKQFLRATDFLMEKCIPVNKSYSNVFDEISEIIIYQQYNYRKESLNYHYTLQSIKTDIYNNILKYCENNVRDVYAIKRKINTDFQFQDDQILRLYEKKISAKLLDFLTEDKHKILEADIKTHKILNETNTNRWKLKFDDISTHFSTIATYKWEIERLVDINDKNPSVSHIYFEAAKFIAVYDKITCLEMYFNYLNKDLLSLKFENKQLLKSQQKLLFKSQEEMNDFVELTKTFILNRKLDLIIPQIPQIFKEKRKKIKIDRNAINDIQKLHSQTVELLDEYLNDDEVEEVNQQKIKTEIVAVLPEIKMINENKFNLEFQFSEIQINILELFEKSSFSITQIELEEYVKSQNLFLNSTIDAINDKCFEMLDDVLIEEDDEYYNIFPDYYKKLLI